MSEPCNRLYLKKLRLILLVVAIISIVVVLGLCTSPNELRFTLNNDLYAKTKVEKILDAIQKEDADAIEKMFSKNAIEGTVQSVDDSNKQKYTDIKDGEIRVWVDMVCHVTTDAGWYALYYRDYLIDEVDEENIGLEQIDLVEKEDWGAGGLRDDFAGVARHD